MAWWCPGDKPLTEPVVASVLKGSNMIVCVLLVSNSRGCCLAAPGDHEDAARVIVPRWDNTRGSLTPTIHTQSCLIPIITWCHNFSTATNILLIKSNLKFESRATAVSVAMSSRYLSGKYRSRLHPRSRKCACLFLRETGRVKSNCARPASSATRDDNEVDHAGCLNAEFQMHTALSNENGKFYTTMIYPCFSRSVCFSMGSPAWWRFGLCSSGSSLVSRWRDAPLVHARILNVTSQM